MAQGMRQGTLVSPPKMCGKEEEKDGAACNRTCRGLQPYVARAATVCGAGCNRMRRGLQPYVPRAATVCAAGCNRMWRGLQP